MYIEEMKHFLGCVNGNLTPIIDVAQGKRVLEIALAAKISSEKGMPLQI